MKDQIYMNMATEYAKFSKCISIKVGCVIVNNYGRIIASGVNGSIPGFENCCDKHFKQRSDHHNWSLENEIHAEMNAILELCSVGYSGNISFYVTHSPCSNCLKHIFSLKRNGINIVSIVYGERYHRMTDEQLTNNISMCKKLGIEYYEICKSGNENSSNT